MAHTKKEETNCDVPGSRYRYCDKTGAILLDSDKDETRIDSPI